MSVLTNRILHTQSSLYGNLHSASALFLFFVFLLPPLFSSLHQNIENLRFHLSWLSTLEQQIERERERGREQERERERGEWLWTVKALQTKLDFFTRLRFSFLLLFLFLFGANLLHFLLPWNLVWLTDATHTALLFAYTLYLSYLLRPAQKEKGLFWFFSGHERENHEAMMEGAGRLLRQMASGEYEQIVRGKTIWESTGERALCVQYPVRQHRHFESSSSSSSVCPRPPSPSLPPHHINLSIAYPQEAELDDESLSPSPLPPISSLPPPPTLMDSGEDSEMEGFYERLHELGLS